MAFIEPHADAAYDRARRPDGIDLGVLDDAATAIRTRCVRRAAIEAGAIASDLTLDHVAALLGLLGRTGKQVQLPGHLTAYAEGRVLHFRSAKTR